MKKDKLWTWRELSRLAVRKIWWTTITLALWSRCSRPLMRKVSWKNACNITLRFKPLMTRPTIKKKDKLRSHLKLRKSKLRVSAKKKEHIPKKKISSTRQFSMISWKRKRVLHISKSTIMKILFSKVILLQSNLQKRNNLETFIPIKHRLQVTRRSSLTKIQLRSRNRLSILELLSMVHAQLRCYIEVREVMRIIFIRKIS